MRRAWVVFLAGCGFQTKPAETIDAPLIDTPAAIDAAAGCWAVAYSHLNTAICPMALGPPITITGITIVDTTAGTTTLDGVSCAQLSPSSPNVCALAATSITIPAGTTLSAHGTKPLILLAHSINVEGTVDVASHYNGPQGAASDATGCSLAARATGAGGGQGGTFDANNGGKGGDSDGGTGGVIIATIGIGIFRGGCPGGASSAGPFTVGGHGGGAIWIGVDGNGTLSIADGAVINASGAGGAGGSTSAGGGGYGGGAGGMILLQAPTLTLSPNAKIFADGGGGGGGASADNPGSPGVDPDLPGVGGAGGPAASSGTPGAGGPGSPAPSRNGGTGTGDQNGGGGGGGGAGTIWIDAHTTTGSARISPQPVDVTR